MGYGGGSFGVFDGAEGGGKGWETGGLGDVWECGGVVKFIIWCVLRCISCLKGVEITCAWK